MQVGSLTELSIDDRAPLNINLDISFGGYYTGPNEASASTRIERVGVKGIAKDLKDITLLLSGSGNVTSNPTGIFCSRE